MAECGTDAQIHVCRYEGGAQAWPSERRTGALSWRRTFYLAANSHRVAYLYVFYLPLFPPIPPLLALLFDKQESQERRFKIHTAKTMNGSDHAGTKGNAAPMPRWVAIAAPPVRPVFAPAAAAPRRPRPFAPARQRVARLARRSVPPVALSRPASSKDGARVRSAFTQPRALFVPFNGRVAPEERGTICG